MDLSLSPEQEAVRRLAADFVDREIVPYAVEWDRREAIDRTVVNRLGDLGLLGLTIPEEMGGSGGDHITYCLVLEELGRGDSAVRGLVSVSLGLVGKTIAAYGTPDQQKQWLPRLCTGEALACFGLTEPGTGSDAASLATHAVRDTDNDGDGWTISGSKMFITNGMWADVVLLFARTGGPGPRGVTAFLVPMDSPGLTRREIHGKLGLRGQPTAELTFDGVAVPDSARVGAEGSGFRIAMSARSEERRVGKECSSPCRSRWSPYH